jgi:2-methylcitrate dehydratase PrpD
MTLSHKLARAGLAYSSLPPQVISKVKLCLIDFLSCAFESLANPPSRQAIEVARRAQGKAAVIGTSVRSAPPEAAFANAVLGHGLVREDMHTGSVSHLGVVIFPVLLAFARQTRPTGREFIRAAVCGYETSAAIGRALMDRENVRRYRPTGMCGPPGAALAAGLLCRLNEDELASAIGLAANTVAGFNEWPASGADEMFFHVGFAARNAVTSVDLAALGAYASETALDGPAGLFAGLNRLDRAGEVALFAGPQPEILSVYHKPAPACNYAQTACQAALKLAMEEHFYTSEIAAIRIRASAAALNYPGCDATGPFHRNLQAKMSIQYAVAATLVRRAVEEANYRLLTDPEVARLIAVTTLEEDAEFTQAYPRLQGTEITLTLRSGATLARRLEDVIPATPGEIRARFASSCETVLGGAAARSIEAFADTLEDCADAGELCELLSAISTQETAA